MEFVSTTGGAFGLLVAGALVALGFLFRLFLKSGADDFSKSGADDAQR